MKNFIQDGKTITLTAPYAVSSGAGLLVGSIFGIASNDAPIGLDVETLIQGVVTIAKTSAQAWTQGLLIYWDDTNKVATSVSTSNKLIGVAVAAAANPSGTGNVLLNGAFIS
jgi:predicted RecA/RadA family phage recombinase